ncbi:MAG: hypothetical protein CR961_01125 [Polaribacter sp.]|nr:MAG: hypothetical protein CR961_01125 [Polaribacter sp.]
MKLIKDNPKILIISTIGVIIFALNNLFNFIKFENPKTNSAILLVFLIGHLIGTYMKLNENLKN